MKYLLLVLLLSPVIQAAVFDDIEFGDDNPTVQQKLMKSKLAETDLPETMIGRTGLNGIFKTTKKIKEDAFELYFTFEQKRLTSMMLKSPAKPTMRAAMKLLEAASADLEKIHGPVAQAGNAPPESAFPVGANSLFRVWHPEEGGSALLGLERQKDGFSVIIKLQEKVIELQRVPAK